MKKDHLHTRRGLLGGLIAFVAAPSIVRAASLMPIKPLPRQATLIFPPEEVEWPTGWIPVGRLRVTVELRDDQIKALAATFEREEMAHAYESARSVP